LDNGSLYVPLALRSFLYTYLGSSLPDMFSDVGAISSPSHNDGFRDEPPPRMACALCRRRKLRCNRQLPCDSCTRLGFDCVYEASKSQHGPKKHRVQKPESPSGGSLSRTVCAYTGPDDYLLIARSSLAASHGSTPEFRHRPVARKASNQSLANTEWSADQLRPEDMAEL
jgi:Fungal Zn(2)-Cys(6) binuclear cluster domain